MKTQAGVVPVPFLCHRPLPGGPCPLPGVLGPSLWLLPSRRWLRAAGSSRAWLVAGGWGPAGIRDFVFPFHLLTLPFVEVPGASGASPHWGSVPPQFFLRCFGCQGWGHVAAEEGALWWPSFPFDRLGR